MQDSTKGKTLAEASVEEEREVFFVLDESRRAVWIDDETRFYVQVGVDARWDHERFYSLDEFVRKRAAEMGMVENRVLCGSMVDVHNHLVSLGFEPSGNAVKSRDFAIGAINQLVAEREAANRRIAVLQADLEARDAGKACAAPPAPETFDWPECYRRMEANRGKVFEREDGGSLYRMAMNLSGVIVNDSGGFANFEKADFDATDWREVRP